MGGWLGSMSSAGTIILFVLVLIVPVALYRWAPPRRESARSMTWPVVKGEVWRVSRVDWPGPPMLETTYTYKVNGRIYTGKDSGPLDAAAKEFEARYLPTGAEFRTREVIVRYNPDKPAVSAIRYEDQGLPT